MAETKIRFGILGCADIARKVSRAILLSPNATISALGSRSIEKAQKFAADNNFPATVKICGSYDAVLDDPDVDAVYIPLPTSLHVRWAILAAEKKKHVILEKPVALNVKELDLILEACESYGVQFMDCTMWMHHPRTAKLKEFLSDSCRFGQLQSVHCTFSVAATPEFLSNNIRVKPDLDALGALGDLGWYCIRAILFATNYELPKTVTALRDPVFNEAGVILSCGASLSWEDKKTATFQCSFLSHLSMDFTAMGSEGTLRVYDYVIPYQETAASYSVSSKSSFKEILVGWTSMTSEENVMTDLPQEALLIKEFSRLVGTTQRDGLKPEKTWPSISRKTQLVVDAVMASIAKGFVSVEVMA